jgi:sugar lactone lactonase YvrE
LLLTAIFAGCGGDAGTSGTNLSAPVITVQPQGLTVVDGNPATFRVTATGDQLSYQWRRNGQPIANATASTYTLAAAQYGQSGTIFNVSVYNTSGSVTSSPAALTVTPIGPSITTPPTTQSTIAGGTATFSVVAAGTTPMAYQWNKNGVPIPGAQSPSWVDGAAQLADNGASITVAISNVVGSITSTAVLLNVQSPVPTIVNQPQPQTVLAPASATFTVLAAGAPPLSFQWLRNGIAIPGANDASYVTPATTLGNNGDTYDVVVTNANGTATSNTALLTVQSAAVAPTITTQPQSASGAVGSSVTFTVAANGSQPLTYQWQAGGTSIAGATGANLTVSPVIAQDNNVSYTVVVSNSVGAVTSTAAVLTVTGPAPGISLIAGQIGGTGNLDANAAIARFFQPESVAADPAGNIFIADTYNSDIREITAAGAVTLYAGSADLPGSLDGVGTSSLFNYPEGIAVDANDNVYVADTANQTIRKITSTGVVSTIAGTVGTTGSTDGPGSGAQFSYPKAVAVDAAGNVYVADTANNTIRRITASGVVSTIAGVPGVAGSTDGPVATALFNAPEGVAVDAAGNLYVADTYNDTIRVITPGAMPTVSTLAGSPGVTGATDGTGAAAQFDHPRGIGLDSLGNIYVADTFNGTVRRITSAGMVTTVAGTAYTAGSTDGTGSAALFQGPWGLTIDAADNLYIADFNNDTVRRITPAAVVTTYAGTAPHPGTSDGTGAAAQFNAPAAAAVDASGNVYIADTSNSTIRKVTPSGVVSTLAGSAGTTGSVDGTGGAAQFNTPQALIADVSGNVYVADTGNNTIRKITSAGVVSTMAGTAGASGSSDGTGPAAQFNSPQGIVIDASGNLYVADTGNNVIRMITPAGVVTTVAGTAGVSGGADGVGAAAQFTTPIGLTIDSTGNIYIADSNNYTIRVFAPTTGGVTTLAGAAGQAGFSDGTGVDARFNVPTGVALDSVGNLYVVDSFFRTIRKITPAGVVTTIAGVPGARGVELGPLPGSFNNPIGIASLPGSAAQLVVPDMGENAILKVVLP